VSAEGTETQGSTKNERKERGISHSKLGVFNKGKRKKRGERKKKKRGERRFVPSHRKKRNIKRKKKGCLFNFASHHRVGGKRE